MVRTTGGWARTRPPHAGCPRGDPGEFLLAARETIEGLSANPLIYQIRSRRKQVRWAYPHPFPYRIVFRVIGDTVVVYAVVHTARHNRHWKPRL